MASTFVPLPPAAPGHRRSRRETRSPDHLGISLVAFTGDDDRVSGPPPGPAISRRSGPVGVEGSESREDIRHNGFRVFAGIVAGYRHNRTFPPPAHQGRLRDPLPAQPKTVISRPGSDPGRFQHFPSRRGCGRNRPHEIWLPHELSVRRRQTARASSSRREKPSTRPTRWPPGHVDVEYPRQLQPIRLARKERPAGPRSPPPPHGPALR